MFLGASKPILLMKPLKTRLVSIARNRGRIHYYERPFLCSPQSKTTHTKKNILLLKVVLAIELKQEEEGEKKEGINNHLLQRNRNKKETWGQHLHNIVAE